MSETLQAAYHLDDVHDLEDLPASLGLRVGYSRIADGNMSYRLAGAKDVLRNRLGFFSRQGLPLDRLATFFTDHEDHITVLTETTLARDAMRGEEVATTDAVITDMPQTGVFLTFADCVPYLVYDRRQHILCFAHIGWRSMAMRFTARLHAHMRRACGSRPEDLVVAVGPSIKAESYLFRDAVQSSQAIWQPFLRPQPDGRVGIDLFGFCMAETAAAGIAPAQVYAARVDTARDPGIFSHYAGTEGGQPHKQGRFVCYGFLE